MYSLNRFATPADATKISGVSGPGGAVALTASGAFNRPFPLLNQTAGTAALYRAALSGPSTTNPSGGVSVAGGQTLAIRLYFACGSTGTPRYAMRKNLRIRGNAATARAAMPGQIANAQLQLFNALAWPPASRLMPRLACAAWLPACTRSA